jgi:aryl-alcohol dehydrogenase-like predicted oxidoreductase
LLTRPIPSTGEPLPVIGCGTYPAFNVSPRSAEFRRLPEVLKMLFDAGGSVIDTSPMYGRAEEIIGRLLQASGNKKRAFLATKVWTRGRAAASSRWSAPRVVSNGSHRSHAGAQSRRLACAPRYAAG